jgi:hypothetical protein
MGEEEEEERKKEEFSGFHPCPSCQTKQNTS